MKESKGRLRSVRDEAERRETELCLDEAAGNIARAARLLGVSRPQVYNIMQKYGLTSTRKPKVVT